MDTAWHDLDCDIASGHRGPINHDYDTLQRMQLSICAGHQAYPTKGELAEAFKGRLFATGKKKMSRLKRIILRERANKAFTDASASLESAAAAARLAAALRTNIREQLRVHTHPSLVTQTCVLLLSAALVVVLGRLLHILQQKAVLGHSGACDAWNMLMHLAYRVTQAVCIEVYQREDR